MKKRCDADDDFSLVDIRPLKIVRSIVGIIQLFVAKIVRTVYVATSLVWSAVYQACFLSGGRALNPHHFGVEGCSCKLFFQQLFDVWVTHGDVIPRSSSTALGVPAAITVTGI